MPITDRQREKRRNHIGSSDAPAIVEVSEWKTRADVFAEHVYGTDNANSKPAAIGLLFEDVLIDWYADTEGATVRKNQRRVSSDGIMASNHDALVCDAPEGVEAKTSGILWPGRVDEWGEERTDQVPADVIVQCQEQMYVSDLERVWVPALIGGRGLLLYCVERDDAAIAIIVRECHRFWNEHILTRTPPTTGGAARIELLSRIQRVPKSTVAVNSDDVFQWQRMRFIRLAAEKYEKDLLARVLLSMGDAEAGECDLGTVTYFEQKRKAYTVPESTFRVARFKPQKELTYDRPDFLGESTKQRQLAWPAGESEAVHCGRDPEAPDAGTNYEDGSGGGEPGTKAL